MIDKFIDENFFICCNNHHRVIDEDTFRKLLADKVVVDKDTAEQGKFAINDRVNQLHNEINFCSQKHSKDQFGREYTKEHIDAGYELLKKLEAHYAVLDDALIKANGGE